MTPENPTSKTEELLRDIRRTLESIDQTLEGILDHLVDHLDDEQLSWFDDEMPVETELE